MAFPTTAQGIESVFVPAVATEQSVSLGNVGIARDTYGGIQVGRFELVYRAISESARDAFFTDFDTDPGSFAFTWQMDSSSHTVVYAGAPQAVYRVDADAWDVFVRLLKVPELGGTIDDQGGTAIDDQGGTDIENQAA